MCSRLGVDIDEILVRQLMDLVEDAVKEYLISVYLVWIRCESIRSSIR